MMMRVMRVMRGMTMTYVDLSTDTDILPFKKTEAWGRKEGSVDLMMMTVMMIIIMMIIFMMIMIINMINSDDVHPRRADSQTLQI